MAKKAPVKKTVTKTVAAAVTDKAPMISKKELIAKIVETSEYTKEAVNEVSGEFFDALTAELSAGNSVSIYGFGTFSIKNTEARKGRNPSTGEAIDIPAGKRISFKASSAIKNAVKEAA